MSYSELYEFDDFYDESERIDGNVDSPDWGLAGGRARAGSPRFAGRQVPRHDFAGAGLGRDVNGAGHGVRVVDEAEEDATTSPQPQRYFFGVSLFGSTFLFGKSSKNIGDADGDGNGDGSGNGNADIDHYDGMEGTKSRRTNRQSDSRNSAGRVFQGDTSPGEEEGNGRKRGAREADAGVDEIKRSPSNFFGLWSSPNSDHSAGRRGSPGDGPWGDRMGGRSESPGRDRSGGRNRDRSPPGGSIRGRSRNGGSEERYTVRGVNPIRGRSTEMEAAGSWAQGSPRGRPTTTTTTTTTADVYRNNRGRSGSRSPLADRGRSAAPVLDNV